jgi:predicted XRE-type DNA-binding protein
MKNTTARSNERIVRRRGSNIYAQLGLANPEERQLKSQLMHVINDTVARMGLNQADAADRAGINQADVSRIFHGQGARFSVERLLSVIGRLGIDIDIKQIHDEHGAIVHRVKVLV